MSVISFYLNLNLHCIRFDWAVDNPFPLCHQWFVSLISILLWRWSFQEKYPTLYRSCSSFLPCFGFCMLLITFKVWEVLRFIPFQNHSFSFSFLVSYWIPILNGYATMGSFLHGDCQLQAHYVTFPTFPHPLLCITYIYLQGIYSASVLPCHSGLLVSTEFLEFCAACSCPG